MSKEDSGYRLVPTPKCSRALASTLPAAPASFAQVYPQVVKRERVPVTTVVWNLGGGYLAAAVSARELNHGRAISRKHAPATNFETPPLRRLQLAARGATLDYFSRVLPA
jgi:hypothetical protein